MTYLRERDNQRGRSETNGKPEAEKIVGKKYMRKKNEFMKSETDE